MYNALLRTHHIASRGKVARLRKAAHRLKVEYVLLRSNVAAGDSVSPGLMYVEAGSEERVRQWVAAVQLLRYKDFTQLRKVAPMQADGPREAPAATGFEEVGTVAAFAVEMEKRGLLGWWRSAMGYRD